MAPGAKRGPGPRVQLPATNRPRCGPTALIEELGALGLLRARGMRGLAAPADRVPGADRELIQTEVLAAATDGTRVVAGLTAGQSVPVQSVHGTVRTARAGRLLGAVVDDPRDRGTDNRALGDRAVIDLAVMKHDAVSDTRDTGASLPHHLGLPSLHVRVGL